MQRDEAVQSQSLRRSQLIVAATLVALSLISKVKLGFVELSGGPTLAALAALILLWPLLRQLAVRGGSTEFMGLKLQINSLERKAEEEFGIRIAELRADLEKIRAAQGASPVGVAEGFSSREPIEVLEKSFWETVLIYNEHDHIGDWSFRVEADKRLTAKAGSFPVSFLKRVLAEHPRDQGVAMAVAVALGARELPEASGSAELIVRLLGSRFERVRFRAARAIERRASRADLAAEECEILHGGLVQAVQEERAEVVREAMETALEALSANPYPKAEG